MTLVPYFTDPFPYESFYSMMARYYEYSSELPQYLAREILFGQNLPVQPHIYMGENLELLAQRLGGLYTPERFLMNNTIYPFFRPFLSSEKNKRVIQAVYGNGHQVTSMLGIRSDVYPEAGELRYCPECCAAQTEVFSRGFFNWLHQLPGIDICLIHHCYLETYPFYPTEDPRENYYSFDLNRVSTKSRPCLDSGEISLAISALQVIEYSDPMDQEELTELINLVLKKKGYSKGRALKWNDLYHDLEDFYSLEYLEKKNCLYNYENRRNHWLKFLSDSFSSRGIHPSHILLLINFLCNDFNSFLTQAKSYKTDTVYNCLNPCCSHFNRPVDGAVYIKHEKGVDKAIVHCSCQMIYSVRSDNHKPMIRQYGSLWYEKYLNLEAQGLPRTEIAKALNVSTGVIENLRRKKEYHPDSISQRIKIERDKLCYLVNNEKISTRKELSKISKPTYNFLYTYDRDFLEQTLPVILKGRSYRILSPRDYSQKDQELCEKVDQVVQQIKEVFPFQRCTAKAIMKKLGISLRNSYHLPKTSKRIKELVENREEFSIRKGCRTVDIMIEENVEITPQNIYKRKIFDIYKPNVYQAVMKYLKETYLDFH